MPSPEKTARINEICARNGLDYFGNEKHKQTIEFILMDEFPDENEFNREYEEVQEEDSSAVYWLVGLGILIFLIVIFWKYVVTFLIILAILLFFGIKGLLVLLAGSSTSSSGSSSSYKTPDTVTYGLQRASGAVWYTIAQGPENWMINKMEQNRAKDNARYRVVRLVNGKPSGTTYS